MFERWDPDRDIKADVPSDFDKLHLFSSIAANMFGDPELADGVEEAWLSAEIKRYLEALYENKSQATAGTKAVVKFITGRAWVMTDVGENVFAFTHQTFLEYFFARHIDEKADSVEEVLSEIIPHVVVKEWDVVAHLSLQIKTHRSLRRQNQAIEQLIELINATSSADERMSLNLFAARALEYLNASESQVKSLVERIFNEAVENGEPNDAFLAIRHCAYCCAERRTFVRSLLLELIVSTFKKGETRQLERLARAMSSVRTGGAVKTAVIPPEIQSAAHQAVKRNVIDRSGESELFAGLAWSWYGHLTEALLRKYGIALFYNGTLEANPFFVDGLTHLVLAGSDQFSAEFPLSPEAARDALVAVGRVGFSTPVEGKQRYNKPSIRGGAPLTFWKSVLGQYKKFPEALIGVFFIFLLVSEFDADEEVSDPKANEFRSDVIETVLKSRALKKEPAYEDIARIARAPIFGQADAVEQ